ncbi:interferon lambda receptor 1 [Pungitius pungitius]|uniref:interferon lambda receptor 1 n=1 Tax=Pungitius pungitius TaxID=134920 RepID=UPI002E12DE78
MTMWSVKVITLLLICYACLSTINGKVSFDSKNFHNVLHWDAAEPACPGEEVLYSVRYKSDVAEGKFLIKEECQNITALVCDLTAETPSVHDVHYHAQVYCNGNLHGQTVRFTPIAKTTLGPPVLSTHSTVSAFYVNVTVPLGPNGVSVADIITRSKPFETGLVYILKITEPLWAATVNKTTTGRFVIGLKNNRTEYCGYVVYTPQAEAGRSESEPAHFCVTLPGDPLDFLPWLLASAALLAAVIATSVVFMCKYVNGGKGKSIPMILSKQEISPSTPPEVMEPLDWNIKIFKVEICIETEKTVETMTQAKTPARSAGYSPQDNLGQNWQDGTVGTGERSRTSGPEDTSAHSSETYGVVVQEPNKNGRVGTGHAPTLERWDPRPTPYRKQALPHEEPDEEPDEDNAAGRLCLHTVLGTKGQLVLLLPQLQSSSAGDRGTPLSPERKPLLSDLKDSGPSLASINSFDGSEFTDSGCDDSTVTTPTHPYCNGHYPPSQPDAPYVQQGWTNASSGDAAQRDTPNCFPALLLETQSKDVCGYRTTGCPRTCAGPKKEEGGGKEEESEVEETKPILLGGWVVHIAD